MDDKVLKATRKAIENPLLFTRLVMDLTQKVRTPSPKVAKIGLTIGGYLGAGLLVTGVAHLFVGKHTLAIGSITAGVATLVSNVLYRYRNKL